MAVSPVIIFIASSSFFYLSAECRMIWGQPVMRDNDPTFQPLCSRMCHPASNFRENALHSFKCSCSKSCAVYKDCCYDTPYKHTMRLSQFEFACISVVDEGDYRAVASCQRHFRAESCSQHLGREPPVTSRLTNITYGNAYCAKCNGDGGDLIKWNVELRCSSENQAKFTKIIYYNGKFLGRDSEANVWRRCEFHVLDKNHAILRNLELRPCSSLQRTSTCSSTWTNAAVKEKCRSYEDPIYMVNTPFRNSHCAECNYLDTSYVDCIPAILKDMLANGTIEEDEVRDCMAKSPYSCILGAGVTKGGAGNGLSDIFNIGRPVMEHIVAIECLHHERYDDNTGGCRPVTKG